MQEQIDALNKELQQAEKEVTQLQANLEAYSKISAYDWYKPHQDIFNPVSAVNPECLDIILNKKRVDPDRSCNSPFIACNCLDHEHFTEEPIERG